MLFFGVLKKLQALILLNREDLDGELIRSNLPIRFFTLFKYLSDCNT